VRFGPSVRRPIRSRFCNENDRGGFVAVTPPVPYKEKPAYNSHRHRAAASRVFKNASFLSPTGNNLLSMRALSSSTPHLLQSRDLAAVPTSGAGQPAVKVQRPSYDSDSPYVDSSRSGGKLSDDPPLHRTIAKCFAYGGTAVERRSLTGELSLSCARPAADG